MEMIQELARVLEPWQSLYGNSKAVSTGITAVHLLALLVGGGLAIAADRGTLRMYRRPAPERRLHLAELRAVHRPVLAALALLFGSGLLLAAADVETFAGSWVFWGKMGLVMLLLGNGILLFRTESRLGSGAAEGDPLVEGRLWGRLRLTATVSLALWILIAMAGAVLTGVA